MRTVVDEGSSNDARLSQTPALAETHRCVLRMANPESPHGACRLQEEKQTSSADVWKPRSVRECWLARNTRRCSLCPPLWERCCYVASINTSLFSSFPVDGMLTSFFFCCNISIHLTEFLWLYSNFGWNWVKGIRWTPRGFGNVCRVTNVSPNDF